MYIKREIVTKQAPAAIGPYSQGVIAGPFVFVSGQIALNSSGELVNQDIQAETDQVLHNIQAILEASGSSLGDVVCVDVFLTSLDDFASMNEVYEKRFVSVDPKPARKAVVVAALPKNARIEIACIALRENAHVAA